LTFAAITVALASGSYVERMKFSAWVLFSILWLTFTYLPIAHWVWGNGFLAKLGALDFAGGTVVHINAGFAALAIAMVLGALLLVNGPIPEMRVRLATALAVSIPLGIITAFLMSIAVRARRNKVVTGQQGLVGEFAVTQTALSPSGKVLIHGELWDAISAVSVPAGERVIVRQVDGLTLRVEPVAVTRPAMV
jgi:membrane-bound ClpP family serine protease